MIRSAWHIYKLEKDLVNQRAGGAEAEWAESVTDIVRYTDSWRGAAPFADYVNLLCYFGVVPSFRAVISTTSHILSPANAG
jgi:hypothetical protein